MVVVEAARFFSPSGSSGSQKVSKTSLEGLVEILIEDPRRASRQKIADFFFFVSIIFCLNYKFASFENFWQHSQARAWDLTLITIIFYSEF